MEEKDAAPDSDEMIAEMWAEFEGTAERTRLMSSAGALFETLFRFYCFIISLKSTIGSLVIPIE